MKTIACLSILTIVLFASCATTSNIAKYTIASQNADCTGVVPQKCLLVKKGDAADWQYFYTSIEGFKYEPGYEYQLKVKEEKRENVPADASSIKYVLVKEMSKVKKISENLPSSIKQQQSVYQCTGKVMAVESGDVGRGAAAGKFTVTVVQIRVTSSTVSEIKEGDVIYCELVSSPKVTPKVDSEYVFRADSLHPAHAKGTYMLKTEVIDLVQ